MCPISIVSRDRILRDHLCSTEGGHDFLGEEAHGAGDGLGRHAAELEGAVEGRHFTDLPVTLNLGAHSGRTAGERARRPRDLAGKRPRPAVSFLRPPAHVGSRERAYASRMLDYVFAAILFVQWFMARLAVLPTLISIIIFCVSTIPPSIWLLRRHLVLDSQMHATGTRWRNHR